MTGTHTHAAGGPGRLRLLWVLWMVVAPLPAAAQEDWHSAFNMTTRGTELGRMPQLYGRVAALCRTVDYALPGREAAGPTWWYFDSHGRILSIADSSGLMEFERYGYRYDHRGRIRSIHGLRQRPGGGWDTLLATTFAYCDTGGLVSLISEHFNDEISAVRYAYTAEGFTKTLCDPLGRPVQQHLYRNHQLASIIDYDDGGTPTDALVAVRRASDGRPTLMADVFEPDRAEYQQQFDYDPFGNVTRWTEGGVTITNSYRYDLRHNWVERLQYEDGRLLLHERRRIEYAADSDDFTARERSHDLFWEESHATGYLEVRYPNGDYYIGDLVEGRCEGQGDMNYADGTCYSGQWAGGRYHGMGVLRRWDATIVCRWIDGRIDPAAAADIHYADGSRYRGRLADSGDSCRYEGVTVFADGGSYQGEYAAERFDGFGTRRLADGTRIEGYWEQGAAEGAAVIVLPNLDRHYVTYCGGVRQPRCVIEYINGDLYEGETTPEGVPSGTGRLTTARGRVKEGRFADGRYKGPARPAKSRRR